MAQPNNESELSSEQVMALKDSVTSIAVEAWRLFRALEHLLNSLEVKEQQRYQAKIRWFVKKTDEALGNAGLKTINYEGQAYDPGIPAAPINLDDFQPDDALYVKQMLEPVIMDKEGRIVRTGTIALGRIEND